MNTIDTASIRALAIDLDGTVLRPDATLSKRTRRALRNCLERGVQVLICTGRAVDAAEQYRLAIGADGVMVYFNGAQVVDMPRRAVVRETLLERDAVEQCVDVARGMDVYFQAFFTGASHGVCLMTETLGAEAAMYSKHTGLRPVIGDLKSALAVPETGCIKGMFVSEPERHAAIRAALGEQLSARLYIAQTRRTFLEVMDARVSKGAGLKLALEQRGLRRDHVIAFGDEENDLPLFSEAAYSVAPANAKEAVRQAADVVVPSNADDGVAEFLENLFHR
ncbi:MAG: Cof-type HAD-IIB family hydrolase [Treponema sp.]|jgi:Cof subfamily protein (haloacid dehalogenase superfamily)|nr:Cof-type HAD-IIB family hydrolase [Treponema sp.]